MKRSPRNGKLAVRVLALDYGSARTGVAVSDASGTLARPVCVVQKAATEAGLAEVARLVAEHEVEQIVVGLPLTLRGEHGKQAAETELLRDRVAGARRCAGRDCGRTVHDGARAAVRRQGARGCRRGRPSAPGLARSRGARMTRARSRGRRDGVARRRGLRFRRAAGGYDDDRDAAPALERLRIIFPEGLNVREMGDRVAAVRRIAIEKRGVTPKLTRARYLAAVKRARPPKAFLPDWKRGRSMEGFLFPALYEFTQFSTGDELVADQLAAFRKNFARANLAYARSKNLTPYDVLKIASMIEKETVAPSERKLVAAVIYNRLHNKMPLGIDATLRYGLHIPGQQVAHEGGDRERQPVQQPSLSRACRRRPSRTLGSRRSRPLLTLRPSTTSTTCGSPGRSGTSSRRARASSCARCASSATPATDERFHALREPPRGRRVCGRYSQGCRAGSATRTHPQRTDHEGRRLLHRRARRRCPDRSTERRRFPRVHGRNTRGRRDGHGRPHAGAEGGDRPRGGGSDLSRVLLRPAGDCSGIRTGPCGRCCP